jgi:hypothetical protein
LLGRSFSPAEVALLLAQVDARSRTGLFQTQYRTNHSGAKWTFQQTHPDNIQQRSFVMLAPSIRTRRIMFASGGPVAVLLAGLLVWQGSNAAFTAQTATNNNNWNAGSVVLTNDAGGAMFAVSNVTPGASGSKCIIVTSNSTVPGVVKTYVSALTAGGLESNITVSIQQGTGGGGLGDCTGFNPVVTQGATSLATLSASNASYGTGLLPWTTGTGPQTKTYKFTWLFDPLLLNQGQIDGLQGKSVTANFQWELQNS